MGKTSRFENVTSAWLLSLFIASTICASTNAAITDSARVANSVNRTNKADRLAVTQPAAPNSATAKSTASSKHTPIGCEAAFSPFANPGLADVLNYCAT
jgi:hypothetical protein